MSTASKCCAGRKVRSTARAPWAVCSSTSPGLRTPRTSASTRRRGFSTRATETLNYNAALAVNAPLASGKAALRASAFYSHDGGFTDNVALGRKDVDRSDIYGARANLLLAPTEALEVRIAAFAQNISRDGKSSTDYAFTGAPLEGDLQQSRPIAEPWEQRLRLASIKADYDLGPAKLTLDFGLPDDPHGDRSSMRRRCSRHCSTSFTAFNMVASVFPDVTSTDKFTAGAAARVDGPPHARVAVRRLLHP